MPSRDYSKDLIFRLETAGSYLTTLATLQRLARSQLDDLVPSVLQAGTTTTAVAKQVDYIVTAYLMGTTPLEDIWDDLDQAHQLKLVNSVIPAVDKLQKLDLGNLGQSLEGTPCISTDNTSPQSLKIAISGPALGYFPDAKQILGGLQASKKKPPGCKLLETDSGISIQSEHDDIGQINLSYSDLEELQHHVVFCHYDLEPRNILVRKASSGKYELAGVIDWEMAGFFPFAYEYGFKDTVLGSSNLSFSWYTMFKNHTSYLLHRAESHVKLIKALRIIEKSRKRSMTRNVGVRVQAKWVQREQVEESSDFGRGWVRKAGATSHGVFTKYD